MIRLIAAVDAKNGIAKKGKIPWHISADMKYFKAKTTSFGGNVLTGRQTFIKSYPGPLPDRRNFILTHTHTPIPGTELVFDLEEFLNTFTEDLWISGGESVFKQVINLHKADEIYLTRIEFDFNCDQFFPQLGEEFKLVERSEPQTQNDLTFTYEIYKRLAFSKF